MIIFCIVMKNSKYINFRQQIYIFTQQEQLMLKRGQYLDSPHLFKKLFHVFCFITKISHFLFLYYFLLFCTIWDLMAVLHSNCITKDLCHQDLQNYSKLSFRSTMFQWQAHNKCQHLYQCTQVPSSPPACLFNRYYLGL